MQHVRFTPGQALCRYCGLHVDMNVLSTHIERLHKVPKAANLLHRLVGTPRKPEISEK